MKDERFQRADERYLDFEDVKAGSIFVANKHYIPYWFVSSDLFSVAKGDVFLIVATKGRPRVAEVKNLTRNETHHVRVDELLRLDDLDVITIGPA